jgi:CheY-like chemotaxis protein
VAFATPRPARLPDGQDACVRNLCAGGARLEHAAEVLEPGAVCELQVALDDAWMTFRVRVVWSRAAGRGRAESGVVFEAIPATAQPRLAAVLRHAGARVLIVAPDPVLRDALATALRRVGYAVHHAEDGLAGLAAAARLDPDVILVDERLEGLSGVAVCRTLRANPTTTRIPVICLTEAADPALRGQLTAAGAITCLTKPFRLDALLLLTEAALATARRA